VPGQVRADLFAGTDGTVLSYSVFLSVLPKKTIVLPVRQQNQCQEECDVSHPILASHDLLGFFWNVMPELPMIPCSRMGSPKIICRICLHIVNSYLIEPKMVYTGAEGSRYFLDGYCYPTLRRWESMSFFSADRVLLGDNEMRIYSDQLVDLLRRVKNLIDACVRVRVAFEFLDGRV
jgi:hypothetical protein